MKTRFLALSLSLSLSLLAACSSVKPPPAAPGRPEPQSAVDARRQAEFDRSQDRWHGARVQELVAKLGQPTLKARQATGREVYIYSKSAKLSGPTGPVDFRCIVRYVLDERGEKVSSHSIEGC